jgi:hypothetical protein
MCPDRREEFSERWKPRGDEDLETLIHSGILQVYTESVDILKGVFGEEHEHTKIGIEKLERVRRLLKR